MDDKAASTKVILEYSRFWVQKVLVPILVVTGLAGSIVTVVVLTRLVSTKNHVVIGDSLMKSKVDIVSCICYHSLANKDTMNEK